MRVKFCGITNLDDALEAARLGAWAIGLNHQPESPRYCEPDAAVEIAAALKRRLEIVGVFVNPTLDELAAAAENESLTMVQLHGDEGPAFCREAAPPHRLQGDQGDAGAQHGRHAGGRGLSHRLPSPRRPPLRHAGGTGESFDWELLADRRSEVPLILAGGLTPDNVDEAIAVAHPFAVDVASGVEAAPGIKDHELMAAFAERARGGPGSECVSAPVQERFGPYGGRYVPEVLVPALDELSAAWAEAREDPVFRDELDRVLRDFVGRPDAAVPGVERCPSGLAGPST